MTGAVSSSLSKNFMPKSSKADAEETESGPQASDAATASAVPAFRNAKLFSGRFTLSRIRSNPSPFSQGAVRAAGRQRPTRSLGTPFHPEPSRQETTLTR